MWIANYWDGGKDRAFDRGTLKIAVEYQLANWMNPEDCILWETDDDGKLHATVMTEEGEHTDASAILEEIEDV